MTWFPILIQYQDTKEEVQCDKPEDIANNRAFKVLKTCVEIKNICNNGQP